MANFRGALATIERLLVRNGLRFALLVACMTLSIRLFEELQAAAGTAPVCGCSEALEAPQALSLRAGHRSAAVLGPGGLCEALPPILTRAAVLARGRSRGVRRVVARRERRPDGGQTAGGPLEQFGDEEHQVAILERTALALGGAVAQEPAARRRGLAEVHIALAGVHSARARYREAARAMSRAVHALSGPTPGGADELLPQARVRFGQLELRHHRYDAALGHFAAALQLEGALPPAAFAAASNGAGWAALMLGRAPEAAEHFAAAWLRASLGRLRGDGSGTPLWRSEPLARAPSPDGRSPCRAWGDGLDADRALALAGLGVASHAGSGEPLPAEADTGASVVALSDCAEDLLSSGLPDESAPEAWVALGLARHAGGGEGAAWCYRRALHLLSHGGHGQDAGRGAAPGLPRESHGLLLLGLVDLAKGRAAHGAAGLDRILAAAGAAAPEAAEWLVRFASALAWAPGGPAYRALLTERAAQLLEP